MPETTPSNPQDKNYNSILQKQLSEQQYSNQQKIIEGMQRYQEVLNKKNKIKRQILKCQQQQAKIQERILENKVKMTQIKKSTQIIQMFCLIRQNPFEYLQQYKNKKQQRHRIKTKLHVLIQHFEIQDLAKTIILKNILKNLQQIDKQQELQDTKTPQKQQINIEQNGSQKRKQYLVLLCKLVAISFFITIFNMIIQ